MSYESSDILSPNTSEIESEGPEGGDEISAFYGFEPLEPEYSKEDIRKMLSEAKEKKANSSRSLSGSSDNDDNLESSRLENLHWCRCRNCVIGENFTLEECKCCKECNILTEKLEGLSCIIEHQGFKNLILNPYALS